MVEVLNVRAAGLEWLFKGSVDKSISNLVTKPFPLLPTHPQPCQVPERQNFRPTGWWLVYRPENGYLQSEDQRRMCHF